jgi:hypothetical protein
LKEERAGKTAGSRARARAAIASGRTSYRTLPEVQEELRRTWARGPGSPAFRPGRFAPNQRALFAFGFSLGGDDASARAVFEQLDRVTTDPWQHLGEPMEVFKAVRRQAYGG